MSGERILCVGLACYDVVHVVRAYPKEDTDQRTLDQFGNAGGNACNNCRVLAEIIGAKCPIEYFGTLAEGQPETSRMEECLGNLGVVTENCPRIKDRTCPNSAIILNSENGSRTILHTNKDLRELIPEDFESKIDLSKYKWVHFEGRNVDSVKLMIDRVRKVRPGLKVSVEVEKVNRRLEELIPLGDVVLVSKDVAKAHNANNKTEALDLFKSQIRENALLVCAWGEDGAACFDSTTGETTSSPAFPPEGGVVDTISAGDCFNAAMIAALAESDLPPSKAVELACRVAGAKVGRRGFTGLGQVYQDCLQNLSIS